MSRTGVAQRALARRLTRAAAATIVVVAFGLRLPAPGLSPPGLYRDEAWNGTDAASILAGDLRLYFPANNGREPLFLYLTAPMVAVLGHTPEAVRLTAALVGTAGVAAAIALGWALFGPATGLLAGTWMAVAPWPVILGRIGLRAGLLPLVLALAVTATARAARRGDRRWAALGGALAGLTLYTYVAAWAGLALALSALAWRVVTRRRPVVPRLAGTWAASALVVSLPLVVTLAMQPGAGVGRLAQVALAPTGTAPGAGPTEVAAQLPSSLARAAGLFVWRGDEIARHNIPGRPMLAPLGALFWLLGLAEMARRARRNAPCALVLGWLGWMLLPTALAQGAPHMLRAVGVLPAAMLPAARGVVCLAAGRTRRAPALGLAVLAAGALAVLGELGATLGYLRPAAGAPLTERLYYDFESGALQLAGEIEQALQLTGCDGSRGVWLDRRLRDGWRAVPYLVDESQLVLTDPYDPILTTGRGTAFLWPHDLDLAAIWSARPAGTRLMMTPGSRERGDLETEDRLLYIAVDGETAEPDQASIAVFDDGLELVGALVLPDEADLIVTTWWSPRDPVDHDVTAFYQVLQDGRRVAGSDAPLGQGWLTVPFWQVGDQVREERRITVPGGYLPSRQQVIVGLYRPPSIERISARLPDGSAVDHVMLRDAATR